MTLDVAKSVKVSSIEGLRSEISALGTPTFMTWRYNRKRDEFAEETSDEVIRRTVNLCLLLDLLSSDGCLTNQGRQALRRARFDQVVAGQVRALLRGQGVELGTLNDIILKSLHSKPPVLPTCKGIWTATGSSMKYGAFSRMLTLLAYCGGAESSQKKIYLRVDPQ